MAFHALVPQSAASTSSSSSKQPCYDVFINHRGKDVKHTLASTIYHMFELMGVKAFLDQEELELGDSFPEAIKEAMRSASVHIAIFSPNYAESPWCLEELSFMLQIDSTIIPGFYGVDPSDLRDVAKGKYADAFRGHQRKRRYNPEKIKEWEEALSRVSYLSGCILDADKCVFSDRGKLLKEIVDSALKKMKKVPLDVDTYPVGLDAAVQNFESEVGSFSEPKYVHCWDRRNGRIGKEEQISILGKRTPIRGIVTGTAKPLVYYSYTRDTDLYWVPLEHCMKFFIKRPSLPGLQLLAVRGNNFREEFAALSRGLVWLRWCSFEGSSLPSWLSLANLRVLELYDVKNLQKELWQDNVQLPLQLRELIITGRSNFGRLPRSIGRLTHLKKIVLKGCWSMSSLPKGFCQLRSLEFLKLSGLEWLSSLPQDFGKLRNLRTLEFQSLGLTTLPDSFKQLKALQSLKILDCPSLMFSSEMLHVLEFMTGLQVLRITECPGLEVLPHLTTQVSSLRELDLRNTGLRELPNNISQLTKLETLRIGSDNLTSLPGSLGELSCLTELHIWVCKMLKSLPESLGRLSNLQSLIIYGTPVVEIPGLGMGPPSGCNLNSLKSLDLIHMNSSSHHPC